MVSLFKEKKPSGIFLIIVLSVVVHAGFFIQPPEIVLPGEKNILYYLLAPMQDLPAVVLMFLYHAIIVVQALLLNYFADNFRLYQQPNFLVALCFIIFSGIFPQWQNIDAAMVSNFLLIFLLFSFARLYNAREPLKTIFNCGIIAGIATLIFPPAVAVIFIGLAAILVMRSFRLNEMIAYLIAVIFPYYLLCGILFLFNKIHYAKNFIPTINIHIAFPKDKRSFLIASIISIFSFLTGFIFMQQNTGRLALSARKTWIIIFLCFLIILCSVPFTAGGNAVSSLMITLPVFALIVSNTFYYSRNKFISALFFWIIVVADVALGFDVFSQIQKIK